MPFQGIATAYSESKIGRDMAEGTGSSYEGRSDLCNWVMGDGENFKGRGFMHITGRCLYTYYDSMYAAYDLINNPDMLATDRQLSAEISVDSMVHGRPTAMLPIWSGQEMGSEISQVLYSETIAKKLSDYERGNDYSWAEAAAIQGQPLNVGTENAPVAQAFSSILRYRCLEGGLPNGITCKN